MAARSRPRRTTHVFLPTARVGREVGELVDVQHGGDEGGHRYRGDGRRPVHPLRLDVVGAEGHQRAEVEPDHELADAAARPVEGPPDVEDARQKADRAERQDKGARRRRPGTTPMPPDRAQSTTAPISISSGVRSPIWMTRLPPLNGRTKSMLIVVVAAEVVEVVVEDVDPEVEEGPRRQGQGRGGPS